MLFPLATLILSHLIVYVKFFIKEHKKMAKTTDIDHINLGFSGSAKGEQAIVDYIKGK